MTSWLLLAEAGVPEGGLFDLDATLPLMAVQVVLLTFILNSLFFRPVGRAVEDRESFISTSRAEAKQKLAQADTVARLGGDEFVVLLNELHADKTTSAEQAGVVAEKIRVALAAPYQLTVTQPGEPDTTVEHQCSASIGVVLFVNHLSSQTDLMKWADAAMYQAKDAGRNVVRFYEPNRPASPADIA